MQLCAVGLSVALLLQPGLSGEEGKGSAEGLLRKAREALEKGDAGAALDLAAKAVARAPKDPQAYLVRGAAYEAAAKHTEAAADYSRAVELDPRAAEAYQRRGGVNFKLGRVAASLADFDKFLELRPKRRAGHWQRGICCYYLGRYEEGARQFAAYQNVDANDVENAVWHYLCLARARGRDKARAALLPPGKDPRIPMAQVYALFKGDAKPADVLAAARAGKATPAQRRDRLFYAHLYLGLYYDSEGDRRQALEQLTRAVAAYALGPYMWDVARVHRDRLRRELAKQER
jgi:lipoprotein NlpI